MRRSQRRILTTHVGNLPAMESPAELAGCAPGLVEQVAWVVEKQRAIGVDVINEGEYTKGGDWLSFADTRFTGFEERPSSSDKPLLAQGKDREVFADFYRYQEARGALFYTPAGAVPQRRRRFACTGPISYVGHAAIAEEIELLKGALQPGEEAFLTSTAPASLEVYRPNEHYASEEDYIYALGEALREEFLAITKAGVILQVDDAWLPALWDRIGLNMGLEAFRRRCILRVEALNHALREINEEQVRYHLCWGSWHGPHAFDIELKDLVDILVQVNAGAYLIEGANARHEHEWKLWETTMLPKGKILIPGVVSHATDTIEHPELVAQRLKRYVDLLGRENVIAGTDCGLGARLHPQIALAKLKSLVDGAVLASQTV